MNTVKLLQFRFCLFQFLLKVRHRGLHRHFFFQPLQLLLILTNPIIIFRLHLRLLLFQQLQLLPQLQLGSTTILHNLRNLLFETRHNLFTRLLHLRHLMRRRIHFLDRLGQLRLQLHNVLRIHPSLGRHTLDEVGIFMNRVLVLHVLFQRLQTFLHGLGLTFQTLDFDAMQDRFFHLTQPFFFELFLKRREFLMLFQSRLFETGNRRVAGANFLFEVSAEAVFVVFDEANVGGDVAFVAGGVGGSGGGCGGCGLVGFCGAAAEDAGEHDDVVVVVVVLEYY
mmetsp:Transcript_98125/g.147164  ORF Transcript_98125/g.147164 Transcript_98125/m.147164 type:complete len:281 (-) Transcript_98125:212-1054(-)